MINNHLSARGYGLTGCIYGIEKRTLLVIWSENRHILLRFFSTKSCFFVDEKKPQSHFNGKRWGCHSLFSDQILFSDVCFARFHQLLVFIFQVVVFSTQHWNQICLFLNNAYQVCVYYEQFLNDGRVFMHLCPKKQKKKFTFLKFNTQLKSDGQLHVKKFCVLNLRIEYCMQDIHHMKFLTILQVPKTSNSYMTSLKKMVI